MNEGCIELPIAWYKDEHTGHAEVKLTTVRYANLPGGWEVVVDLLIEGLKVARQEMRNGKHKPLVQVPTGWPREMG